MDPVNRCPNCRAPNPNGRTACWSCGSDLVALHPSPASAPAATVTIPAANPWGMDAYRRSCSSCGEVHGIYNRVCPKCGAPPAAPTPINSSTLPSGWSASPTPDGATRLRLSGKGRLNIGGGAALVLAAPLLLSAVLLTDAFSHPRRGGTPLWIGVLMQVLITAIFWYFNRELLPTVLYGLLGTEEWIARPGSLEIRRSLFGHESRTTFDSGALFLTAHRIHTWRSRYILARLRLDVNGRRRTLSARLGRNGIEQLEALGGALAQLTGLPFHVEPDAADLKKPWLWY